MADYDNSPEEAQPQEESSAQPQKLEVPEARRKLVSKWVSDVKAAKKHWEDDFKRMRACMKMAREGSDNDTWIKGDNYVVPIINRHIGQAVATLYARNPKVVAKRKPKLLYQVWDGDLQSLQAAMAAVAQAQQAPPVVDASGMLAPAQPDPNAVALVQEVMQVKRDLMMHERLGRTLEILFAYYLDEQDAGYREQIKAAVRRAKTNGVAYVKLGYQRQMQPNPDVEAQIADTTDQIARIEALMTKAEAGDLEQESAQAEELRLLLADLQSKAEIIVREGPVLSFPRSTEVIFDKKLRHLKTMAGAEWWAHEFDMTPEKVLEVYKVDLKKGGFRGYDESGKEGGKGGAGESCARVWEVQHKTNGQVFTICDGYPDFLKEPAEPDVQIERFWTLFPLVFNEAESEDSPYPLSDVWAARHMQREYNTARQGLREHRVANRPLYAVAAGRLEKEDFVKLGSSPAHSVLELQGLTPGEKTSDVLMAIKAIPIDPALYETESVFQDVQRAVGSQEANLGGSSRGRTTATESSIAENSRLSASADNTDDLDSMLTALARGMGQVMLLELSIDTVREIAGPGAVWPQMRPRREEIVKDLFLDIEAGSSGRPNKAADLANMERAAPWLLQLPGLNPEPLLKKGLRLLDVDLEDAIAEGAPSIVALNQMAGSPAPAASNEPGAQGGQGGANAAKPPGNEPGSQPAFPGPGSGLPPV